MLPANMECLWRELLAVALARTHNSHDAEDLVQSALLRAVEHETRLAPNTNWRAWLRTVLRHLTIDLARHHQTRRLQPDFDPDLLPAPGADPERRPPWHDVTPEQLEHAVAACDRMFRDVYELHYRHGLSYAEIGARMNLPTGTVATRVYRARARIRSQLEGLAQPRGRRRRISFQIRRLSPEAWERHILRRGQLRSAFVARNLREQIAPAPFIERQLSTSTPQFEGATIMKIKKIEPAKDNSKKDAKDTAGVQVKTAVKAGAASLVAVCG